MLCISLQASHLEQLVVLPVQVTSVPFILERSSTRISSAFSIFACPLSHIPQSPAFIKLESELNTQMFKEHCTSAK